MITDKNIKQFILFTKLIIQNSVSDYTEKQNKYYSVSVPINNIEEVVLSSKKDDEMTSFFDYDFAELDDYITDKKKRNIVKNLTEKEKEIIKLEVFNNYKAKDIAKVLNTSENNIFKIKSRMNQKIKKQMEE